MITPTPEQIERYRTAWQEAHKRNPGDSPRVRAMCRHYVAIRMTRLNVPSIVGGDGWSKVRPDWAEVLNRIAFEKEPQK